MTLWLIATLAGCGYEVPLDPDAEPVLNAIHGTVVIPSTAMGDAFVLLYDANDPPPPVGTGSPHNLTAIAAEDFDTDSTGLRSAPYALTRVPDGDWLVTALVDVDSDFHPLLVSTSGATCGDLYGAHLSSLTSTDPAVVSVEGGELVDDILALVAAQYGTERPAFALGTESVSQASETPYFTLDSVGIASELVELSGPFDGTDPCGTMFPSLLADADEDGLPDPHPDETLAAQFTLN